MPPLPDEEPASTSPATKSSNVNPSSNLEDTRDFSTAAAVGDADGVARNRLCAIERDEEVDAEDEAMLALNVFVAMTRLWSCFILLRRTIVGAGCGS
jgi:hypothetical protein